MYTHVFKIEDFCQFRFERRAVAKNATELSRTPLIVLPVELIGLVTGGVWGG